jgi:phosphoribosylanthranilate isomerase
MRDEENIRALEKTAIDWMGFIFHPGSPRYVSDDNKRTEAILSCSKIKVGVFVNEEQTVIERRVSEYRLDYIQLHGDESPETCHALKDAGYQVIKAFRISSEADFRSTAAYESFADYFLFDTKDIGYGGTGRRFDWSLLEAYQGKIPFLLSGGIGAEHAEALSAIHHPLLAGIDLNSRFEYAPALKDVEKIERFVCQFKILKNKKI